MLIIYYILLYSVIFIYIQLLKNVIYEHLNILYLVYINNNIYIH